MASNKTAIRRRIKSVNSTLQITKAMELVATSKLQRQRNRMLKDKEYADLLYRAVSKVLQNYEGNNVDDLREISPYLATKVVDKPLVIIFGSDTGLCGAYNLNLAKFMEENTKPEDLIVACGTKIVNWCKHNNVKAYKEYPTFEKAGVEATNRLANMALDLYDREKISSIKIIYTEYVNSVTFRPKMVELLPVDRSKAEDKYNEEILFEPNPVDIINALVPMYIRNLVYSYLIRSKTSEQASRRMAMETATDNGNELHDTLVIEYNKARQAAITQEITEISSNELGRDA